MREDLARIEKESIEVIARIMIVGAETETGIMIAAVVVTASV